MDTHVLNRMFEKIYVLYINEFELTKIRPKLQKHGIMAQMFLGYDGKQHMNDYVEFCKTVSKPVLNVGSFGHLNSFKMILMDALDKGFNKILILEPDVYFCERFSERMTGYFEILKDAWDVLYLGASQNVLYKDHTWDNIKITPLHDDKFDPILGLYSAYKTLGTFAIGLDKSVLQEYYDQLAKMEVPSDVVMTSLQDKFQKCFVCYPNLICSNVSISKTTIKKNQIETMEKMRWHLIPYEFVDEVVVSVGNFKSASGWVEVEICTNSHLPTYSVEFYDEQYEKIFPTINKTSSDDNIGDNTARFFTKNRKLCVYMKTPPNNKLKLIFNGFFPDGVSVKHVDLKAFKKSKFIQMIKESKNEELKTYYKACTS